MTDLFSNEIRISNLHAKIQTLLFLSLGKWMTLNRMQLLNVKMGLPVDRNCALFSYKSYFSLVFLISREKQPNFFHVFFLVIADPKVTFIQLFAVMKILAIEVKVPDKLNKKNKIILPKRNWVAILDNFHPRPWDSWGILVLRCPLPLSNKQGNRAPMSQAEAGCTERESYFRFLDLFQGLGSLSGGTET